MFQSEKFHELSFFLNFKRNVKTAAAAFFKEKNNFWSLGSQNFGRKCLKIIGFPEK